MVKGKSFLIFRELNKYKILSIGSSIPLPNEGTDFTNANTFAYAYAVGQVGYCYLCNFLSRMFLYIFSSFFDKICYLITYTSCNTEYLQF